MMKKVLLLFMQSKLYSWLLMKVVPFIRFTMYYTSFPGYKFYTAYLLLRPGDILVSKDKKKLTTMLVGGEWTHAALCVSKDKMFEIAEMTHKNFTRSTFFDFCKENDEIAIYRLINDSPDYIDGMIIQCLSMSDTEYDNQFKLGVEALYCSELVYLSDFERRIGASLDDIAGLGREYISPTGLTKGDGVKLIYDSRL